ncbi:MAG TPA: hotdog domain-containing protein [Thermoanaerobaculia bacterium]|nr:hotdog domain-containing protein [Thermoanaerobaculia bacterium]
MENFNAALGLSLAEDGSSVILDTRPEHQVAPEVIHFAVLATLGEVAAAQAAGGAVVPASVTVQLLTRARPGRLVGKGRLLCRGRTLVVAEGEVFQDENLVAKVAVTFAAVA